MNGATREILHSSAVSEWETPSGLYHALDTCLHFNLDPACTAMNAKLPLPEQRYAIRLFQGENMMTSQMLRKREMIAYKLTDKNLCTYGGAQWIIGQARRTSGKGDLCGPGWIHCYTHPLLAVFLNPIHAGFSSPRLFRCRVGGQRREDSGLKVGVTRCTLAEELPLPVVTDEQRLRFAILCALQVHMDPSFREWAENWLSGKDRSAQAAEAATRAAEAAEAAAQAAVWAVVWAAEAAEAATWAAVWAAEAATRAVVWAAEAAARAAKAGRLSGNAVNLIALAEQAMEKKD